MDHSANATAVRARAPRRQPTDAEYAAYDGMHCHALWRTTSENWRCPGCGRSKRGILIWGTRKGHNAINYGPVGWKTALHKHHDHGPRDGLDFNGDYGRFPAEIICGACNAIDGNIKTVLGLPAWFSFSPAEIRRFILVTNTRTLQAYLGRRSIQSTVRYSELAPGRKNIWRM